MDSLPSRCIWIFVLILLTGVLRCFETAVNNVNEAKLQKLADGGNKSAKRALFLTENPNGFYNSVRVLTIFIELVLSFIGAYFMPKAFFSALPSVWGIALSIAVLAVFILVFGVYAPKRVADLHGDAIVLRLERIMRMLYYLGLPFSFLLTWVSNLFLMCFGIKPNDAEEEVTEEEIRMMVDIGSESGAIDPEEKEMIHNIFELDDTQVGDIMTHRTDTELLWLEDTEEWKNVISETNHTIYPVCDESVDNIIGTINSKDFYRTMIDGGDVKALLRTPYFVPETLKADDLFRQMQKTKTHFAVVLDEYGGLGGIITMSDLLEEIVGNLSNEYDDNEEDDIVQIDADTYKISGSCDIDLVSEALNVDLPIEEYNTFAGMILGELGEIPDDGATPELEAFGLQIKVTEIRDHRIESTLVTPIEKVQDED